jgi:hypothetical protein
MSVKVDLKITPGLQAALSNLQIANPAMKVAGRVMLKYFKDYHTAFIPRWQGPHHIAGGSGSGRFGADIVQAWQTAVFPDPKHFYITNLSPYLGHKVKGGPIKPKRAKALTIPLIAQAKGRMAAEFQTSLGLKLFRRGNVLSYNQGKGKNIKTFNAYALSKGVNQAPWPGAMPPESDTQKKFLEAIQIGFNAVQQSGGK